MTDNLAAASGDGAHVDALSRALADRQTYCRSPEHAPGSLTEPIEICETHISWVALVGGCAYKVKKPVRFEFLDYSTLERRHAACEVELRLNRRWAPDLYLGLSRLVQTDDGLYFDVPGTPIEYAVRMRRFSRADELDALLARGAVTGGEIATLAGFIARVQAQPAGSPPAIDDPGDPIRRVMNALDGIQVLRPAEQVQALSDWVAREWQRIQELLQRRRNAGRVIECHGDLHCGNIVRIAGHLVPFDGIDFDPALRWIDAASDIAFLLMDLQAHSREDLAAACLTTWLESSLDYEAVHVLPFFLAYRALVRAHISLLQFAQLNGQGRPAREQRATRYLRLAMTYPARRVGFLVLMHGYSGSGKSVVAAGLVGTLPAVRVRADVIRQSALAAVPVAQRYAPASVAHTYDVMARVARSLLITGFNVIVDATFLESARRQQFAALSRETGAALAIVSCTAPLEVLMARVGQRRDDPSEATPEVLAQQVADSVPLAEPEGHVTIVVRTDVMTDIAAVATQVRTRILAQSRGVAQTVSPASDPPSGVPP